MVRTAEDFVHVPSRLRSSSVVKMLLVLLLLGPPVLRLGREAGTALEEPLSGLDLTYLVHLGIWAISGLYVVWLFLTAKSFRGYVIRWFRDSSAKWYIIFLVLAALSTMYSVHPAYTLYFATKLWVSVFMVLRLAQTSVRNGRDPLADLLKAIFSAYAIGFALLSLFLLVAPELVTRPTEGFIGVRLTGGFLADYGSYSLFTLVALAVWYFNRSRTILGRFFGLLTFTWPLFLLGFAQTRTTLFVAVLALMLILVCVRSPLRRLLWLFSLGLLGIPVLVLSWEVLLAFLARGQDTESLLSVSGRRYMFDYMIDRWRESPMLGFGFHAGSRLMAVQFLEQTGLNMGSAHDALSKVLVDLGVLGAFCLGVAFSQFWGRVWALRRVVRRDLWVLLVFLGLYGLVGSVTSGGVADPSALWPAVFLAPTLVIVRKDHAALSS